jgi:Uncharacterized protein related to glutamine synthetase
MSTVRSRALSECATHQPQRFFEESQAVSSFFARYVFDKEKMQRFLSKEAYRAVLQAIEQGERIDRNMANQIAEGMKTWAMGLGATHYAHWFHPLTDATAEKHEAFVEPARGGGVFENFDGNALVQQEPDASSFPNGGLRNTFEARGYTAWDPSSPAFVIDQTLCVPTIFVAYTGEALDVKAPHLKSLLAIDREASALARLFDPQVTRVNVMLGIEQEYFLVDEALYRARPDLMLCGRTLVGHISAKDQQLEDHYFGAIPSRVMAFMKDFETEAYKLGVVLKTRHNEVAPMQYEFAPYYEEANLAIDHNQLMMLLMRKTAKKHKFRVIFHEKPFSGVNGSGKHCNWSMVTDTGVNLLSPGKTPEKNLSFLSLFACVLRGVFEHHHLMMAGIASLNNSFRLGAAEAPPAVMSVFSGSTLSRILDQLEGSLVPQAAQQQAATLDVVHKIPEILVDNTDRNRTSPFAFTGNRFEFRAVGSSANCATPLIILNAAVAQQIKRFRLLAEAGMAEGLAKDEAILEVIRQYLRESKAIRFEGNGYADEWHQEATRRGLKGISDIPEAFKVYLTPSSVQLFEETAILSKRELEARYEIKNETYVKKLQIEARVLGDLVINHVIPIALRYQNMIIQNVLGLKQLFSEEEYEALAAPQLRTIKKIGGYVARLREDVHSLIGARKTANGMEALSERAAAYSGQVLPLMGPIRDCVDKLEMLVDDEMWPLPKYRELMFLR